MLYFLCCFLTIYCTLFLVVLLFFSFFSGLKFSGLILLYLFLLIIFLCDMQSSAVQSGEQVMQHGRSIDDKENIHGQIPRLLGSCRETILYFYIVFCKMSLLAWFILFGGHLLLYIACSLTTAVIFPHFKLFSYNYYFGFFLSM